MANQAIALQARAPQTDILGGAIRNNAQLINTMSQQRTAERQNAMAQQQMQLAQAKEAREAALAGPQMAEASAKAGSAKLKYANEFFDVSALALSNVRDAQQATMVGDRLKQLFPEPEFQQAVDQTLASIPQDPAQFPMWREESLMRTLDAKDQLAKEFTTQSTGAEQRIVATPKYGSGAASEVPGSRIQVAEGMTYVRDDQGNVYAMPKQTPGSFGSEAPSVAGPAKGGAASALHTNPGALKDGPFARSQPGYAGASGGFATFETPQAGIAAQESLLRGSYINKGFNTVSKIIDKYAPQGRENSAASVANYKKYVAQQAGIDINAPISPAQIPVVAKAMREFETGQTQGRGSAGGPVIRGSGATAAPKTTEDERKISSNVRNMISAAKEMASVVREDPSAIAPSGGEYAAGQVPFYGDEAARFAQSGPRQRFNAALEKVLSAVTFINTGAGVSKEQMEGYRRSYFPTYQDTERTRQSKLLGVVQFIRDAKARAGNAWTPELDGALTELQKMFGAKATYKGKAAAPAATRTAAPAASGGKVLKYNPATGDFE